MSERQRISRRTFMEKAGATVVAFSTVGFPGIVKSSTKLDEVPIAVVIPMTGPTGSFGQNMLRGWNIAVDEVNAEGGIKSLGGAKIKTVIGDTQSNPRIGMAEVEKVAQDKKIPLMVGCWGSAVTFPVSQVSEQYGLPHIIDAATQTDILKRGFKYVFRYTGNTERSAQRMVEFAEDMGKRTNQVAKRAALLSVDDNFGREAATALRKILLEKTSQEVVEEIYYPGKVTNLDVEIAKVKAARTDVVYAPSFLNDSVLIARALYAQRVNLLGYVAMGGISQPEYLQMVGDLGNFFCAIARFDHDLNRPMDQEFDAKMMKRYGVPPNQFSAIHYGIVYLIKDVLERAGTVERDKVRDAIAATEITSGRAMIMPGKFIRFDEHGENVGAADLIAQVIKKEWHIVWPMDWKRKFDPVWPIPKWETRK